MAENSRTQNAEEDAEASQSTSLQHLRDLIVGPTEGKLQEISKELSDRKVQGEEVSLVLAEAVRKSARKDSELASSLAPIIGSAFKDSIRRNPQELADAVSPIMGPAIRQSIRQQIRSMIQSLNKTLDQSFSPKGIRWRIEAWRTGKPFAEIVFLNTLIYRIEQLLLIDSKTGLLMQSVSALDDDDDADLVSSMLSAIQDFVRDSFEHQSDKGSTLQTMRTGELTIWLHHGPVAHLAVALRGEPPIDLRQDIAGVLERIHIDYGEQLQTFDGNTSPMEIVRPDLEELLIAEFVDSPKEDDLAEATEPPTWQKHLPWAIAALLILALCCWGLVARKERLRRNLVAILDVPPTAKLLVVPDGGIKIVGSARGEWVKQARNRADRLPEVATLDLTELTLSDLPWLKFFTALREAPGIAIMSTERVGNRYVVHGLLDRDAVPPNDIAGTFGLDRNLLEQHWEPYVCLDDRVACRRELREQGLQVPSTVKLEIENGQIRLIGDVSQAWFEHFQLALPKIAMPYNIDYEGLRPQL